MKNSSPLLIKIKKLHPDAVIPRYAKPGDAGMDLVAVSKAQAERLPYIEYKTGLAIEIPEGYMGLIFPRSSISKTAYYLANAVGVIDSGYRGEISVRFKADAAIIEASSIADKIDTHVFKLGDKIAQLVIMPYPQIEFEEVEELSKTSRGEGRFGSTGN
jgi:dUTP pyrophosphatase